MSKNYTADKIENMTLRIIFSTSAQPVYKETHPPSIYDNREYYAAYQEIHCTARNGVMSAPVTIARKYYGAPKDRPWTAKEVGDAIKNFSTLNTVIYNDVKAIYLDAINEDIS